MTHREHTYSIAFNDVIEYRNEKNMATLTIRKLDPAIKERLRVRAAYNGRSMEAELRAILTEVVASERNLDINLAEKFAAGSRRWAAPKWRFHCASPVANLPLFTNVYPRHQYPFRADETGANAKSRGVDRLSARSPLVHDLHLPGGNPFQNRDPAGRAAPPSSGSRSAGDVSGGFQWSSASL